MQQAILVPNKVSSMHLQEMLLPHEEEEPS
jgi:hypothetical protein